MVQKRKQRPPGKSASAQIQEQAAEASHDAADIAAQGQAAGELLPVAVPTTEGTPPSGRRQAFRDLRRELTPDDLKNPGVHKMLLDQLDRADADCERLGGYVERFHEADKRAAVLGERGRTQTTIEILFGV